MQMVSLPLAFGSALALVACSSRESGERAPDARARQSAAAATHDTAYKADGPAAAEALTLYGLGDLVIGEPVPAGSSFAERGAQTGDNCRTVTSPEYPGVYAIVEDGEVRRITVGQGSDVKLVEGVGVGSTQAEAMKSFPGFRSDPHKYVEAPAKYLTQPGKGARLRFEIGRDGLVSLIHAGLMPQLAYVEGCA